ncbi:MAG: TldD/PmbA family protein [Acidobacteriota bacterium]
MNEVIHKCLNLFKAKGIEGEVFLINSRRTKITVSSGKVDTLEEREERGCGIRVFHKKRIGFSYTSDLSEGSLHATIQNAYDFSLLSSEDDSNILPPPMAVDPLESFNASILEILASRKIAFAARIEESARKLDPRIEKVREATYKDFIGDIYLANTAGVDLFYRAGRAAGYIELSATDGRSSQAGSHHAFGLTMDDIDPEEIGRIAARKALDKLGARDFKTAKTKVVLSNEMAANLLAETALIFSAKKVLKNKSLLIGKLGKKIASTTLTLIDDGRKSEGFFAAPFDGEGVPTRETFIIREGHLENYLHNYQTALKMNLDHTSNCVRNSSLSSPKIGISNLYVKPSSHPPEEIIGSVNSGIYITDLLGLHTADTITGDFSLGAAGRVIENGRLSYPVQKIAISGNLLTLLESVEAVGNDLKFSLWSGGGVTLLLKEMSVSGT